MPHTLSVLSSEDNLSVIQRFCKAAATGNIVTLKQIFATEFEGNTKYIEECDIDDDRRQNALLFASRAGHDEIVEFLITIGSNVDFRSSTGATAVISVVIGTGSIKCLKLLINANANLNIITYFSESVVYRCCELNSYEALQLLVDAGADVNIATVPGESPLMICARKGHDKCMKILLDNSVNLNAEDSVGWTALSLARYFKKNTCIDLLVKAKAIEKDLPSFPIDPFYLDKKLSTNEYQPDVDEMKIQTMYKMVEDCTISIQGKEVPKKVLYLTNKQAVMFDEEAMERAKQALDIGDPKFVIRLLGSTGMASTMKIAHPERNGLAISQYGKSSYSSSEISTEDERIVEKQILLFMKTCILPLAMQTKALIFINGSNDCSLSCALSKVVLNEQARLGKDCPFTVIATAMEKNIHYKAVSSPNSVSAQVARNCSAWKKRIVFMNDFYSQQMMPEREKLQQCDLSEAAERYIIFEGYEDAPYSSGGGCINDGPRKSFESILLQIMTRKLPSIAIQCLNPNPGIPFLVDLVSRSIPVLVLDTTERCFTSSKYNETNGPMTKLAKESLAFPKVNIEQAKKITVDDNTLSDEGMKILLDLSMEMVEKKMSVLANHGTNDCLDLSLLAFFHRVLTIGNQVGISSTGFVPLFQKIKDMERLERTNKDMKKALVHPDLVDQVMEFIFSRVGALDIICQCARTSQWLNTHENKYRYMVRDAINHKNLLEAKIELLNKEEGGKLPNNEFDGTIWLSYFDILMSPNTFSGSIFDIDEIKRILGSVAKIDRLPSANSLEALRTLQDAWDYVEIYHDVSQFYKTISKVTYTIMLMTGIILTVLSSMILIYERDYRLVIIVLSFFETIVAGFVSYTSPTIKWQQLRLAALTIESNIWIFRTRAGAYRTSGEGFDQSAEKLLADNIEDIKENVLEGADVKNTAFFSRVRSQNKHGQHPSSHPSIGPLDNFAKTTANKKKNTKDFNSFTSSLSKNVLNKTHPESESLSNLSFKNNLPLESEDNNIEIPRLKTVSEVVENEESTHINLVHILDWITSKDDDNEYNNGAEDSHYEPLQPDMYIRHRLLPALEFYKEKIPKCNRTRNISQTLLLLGTIGGAALAIANLAYWVSVIAIITSSLTAYVEFSGINSKIGRYSYTVHALQKLVFWWQTIPQIERSVVANIDKLVLTCEELLQREQQAWRSTSQALKMLQKQKTNSSHSTSISIKQE